MTPGHEPLADPFAPGLFETELDRLPAAQKGIEAGGLQAILATADQIPAVLHEIGRQRERTFRAVGEGTGTRIDLDWFDSHYVHLVLWDPKRREIAGGCRFGQTELILPRFGPDGLYTSTLFEYRTELLARLTPGLEVGRSFVCPEYQRSYAALLLLWKGIGGFVARNPRCRRLFGAVSISNDYRPRTRLLLVEALRANWFLPSLARFVRPRTPPDFRDASLPFEDPFGRSIEEISAWISRLERDERDVPVLLRQYLKLGGRFLGFNEDRSFQNALDALVVVDLSESDPRALQRYMGTEGVAAFLGAQRWSPTPLGFPPHRLDLRTVANDPSP